jgi:signal peptidase I
MIDTNELVEQEEKETKVPQESTTTSFLKELPLLIITAVVIAYLIKAFIIQPFYIPSSSMKPTFYPGDRVLVSKFVYWFTKPKPGDIVVFEAPRDTRDFIKRVVATEGQTIEVRLGKVYINGKPRSEPYVNGGDYSNFGPIVVPKDAVFVMGDNRANSMDSRVFGPLPERRIIGKAFLIYWPPNRIQLTH